MQAGEAEDGREGPARRVGDRCVSEEADRSGEVDFQALVLCWGQGAGASDERVEDPDLGLGVPGAVGEEHRVVLGALTGRSLWCEGKRGGEEAVPRREIVGCFDAVV